MDIRKIYEYALQREYEGKRSLKKCGRLSHAAAVVLLKNWQPRTKTH